MTNGLDKLNISLISNSNNKISLYSIKTPRDIFDGSASGIGNILSGSISGLFALIVSPIISYKKNGNMGLFNGFLQGLLLGSLLSTTGIFCAQQCAQHDSSK